MAAIENKPAYLYTKSTTQLEELVTELVEKDPQEAYAENDIPENYLFTDISHAIKLFILRYPNQIIPGAAKIEKKLVM